MPLTSCTSDIQCDTDVHVRSKCPLPLSQTHSHTHLKHKHTLMAQNTQMSTSEAIHLLFFYTFFHTQSPVHISHTYTVSHLNASKQIKQIKDTHTHNTSTHTTLQHTQHFSTGTHMHTHTQAGTQAGAHTHTRTSPFTSCPWCQKHVVCFLCQQVHIPDRKPLYDVSKASKLNMGDFR